MTAPPTLAIGEDSPDALDIAFVLGVPRSGTTLLRALLDAHAEISCPAETGLPSLIAHTRHVWGLICASANPNEAPDPLRSPFAAESPRPTVELPTEIEEHIRRTIGTMIAQYRSPTTRLYCDKSLGTAQHLRSVHRTFPQARFIVIVRHVMDTILSGLEASPWGFSSFGYAPFVSASPENTVAALAQHWEAEVGVALEWHRMNPDRSHLLRYEDLVNAPRKTLTDLFEFLGVANDPSVLSSGLARFVAAGGPGDYKLAYTSGIDERSVGRGRRVPLRLIPLALLDRINGLLTEAGYPLITDSWNSEPDLAQRAPPHLRRAITAALSSIQAGSWDYDIQSIAIIADDDPTLRWIVEPDKGRVRTGDGDVDLVIAGASADLLGMLEPDADLAHLTLSGRIRKIAADPDLPKRVDLPRMLSALTRRFEASPG